MSAVQNGQIIEACLYLLDRDPAPHSSFGSSAITIANIAQQLHLHPGQVLSRQVVESIAPLAETLFPQPRQPVPKVLNGERWVVFDTAPPAPAASVDKATKQMHRRTTMLNRPALPSQSAVAPPVPPLAVRRQPTLPPLPSAPIRQTSSDELVDGLEVSLPAAEPRSASHGKRSFLRPFLLKSKKKTPANLGPLPPTPPRPSANRSPPPAPAIGSPDEDWTHVSPQLHAAHPVRSDTVMTDRSDVSAIVDEYLQDLKPELESPYEETAFIEESEGSNPVTHPLRQATIPDAPSQQVTPMGSPLTATPDTVSRAPAATIQTRQADHGPPVSVAQLSTPPISAIPDTPASPSAPTIAKVDSAFNDPSELHGTQGTASPPRSRHPDAERDSRRRREDDQHERHRSRARERDGGGRGTGDEDRRERLRRREQEHRRSDDKRERRSRKEREEPPTWLEGVFDGLPFGPNISTVKVVDSVQRDWRLFMAELIALVGLAYVVQASGW